MRQNRSTAQVISLIATHFSLPCRLSVCRLSHSRTLFKLFGGFTCYLAGTIVGV